LPQEKRPEKGPLRRGFPAAFRTAPPAIRPRADSRRDRKGGAMMIFDRPVAAGFLAVAVIFLAVRALLSGRRTAATK